MRPVGHRHDGHPARRFPVSRIRLEINVSPLAWTPGISETAPLAAREDRQGDGAMLIGYARVSTLEQNLDLQEDALKAAGCQKVYTDKTSGTKAERAGLERALADVRPGDSLVVWKLDRLGRSLKHLIETVTDLGHRGVGFRSLQEAIDTTTSGGKLIFHVFGALAEFERDIIRERTLAGLAAARARGRKGGRPRNLDHKKKRHAVMLHSDPTNSVEDICRTLGISKATLYRYLAEQKSR